MTPMDLFLRGLKKLSGKSKKEHSARIREIAKLIEERWGVRNPFHWKVKHLRWVLEVKVKDYASTTRRDYYYSVLKIAEIRGRSDEWAPHLRGPWAPSRKGPGGRPRIQAQRVDEPGSDKSGGSDES